MTNKAATDCPGPDPISRLLSGPDVQRCFGRTERTLRRWARQGLLLPLRIGGSVFYRHEDITSLIENQLLRSLNNEGRIAAQRPGEADSVGPALAQEKAMY